MGLIHRVLAQLLGQIHADNQDHQTIRLLVVQAGLLLQSQFIPLITQQPTRDVYAALTTKFDLATVWASMQIGYLTMSACAWS